MAVASGEERRNGSLAARMFSAVRCRWRLGVAIVVGSSMHATGHALLAGAAGLLVQSLARPDGDLAMDSGRSTLAVTILNRTMGGPAIRAVLMLAGCGVVAAVMKLVGGALSSWAEAGIAGDVGGAVRLEVVDRVLAVGATGAPRQDDHGSAGKGDRALAPPSTNGERLAALTTHIHDIERGVSHGVFAELRALVQLVPLAVLLVLLAPQLAASAVVAMGSFGVLAFALRRTFKRAHARALEEANALVDAADEAVRHAELWATYGARRRIRAHVAGIGRALAREGAHVRVRASIMSSTSEVLGALALLLVLILASRGAFGVDQSVVVPFAITFFMAYKPLRELVDGRLARARGEAALRLVLPAGPSARHGRSVDSDAPRGGDASSPRRPWPVRDLSLTELRSRRGKHASLSVEIPAGSITAIVGPTGIGKTSLLRALLGLEPECEGSVHYGASSLDGAGVGPNERPFAWVPQDAPIVGDTLAVNVALGRADDDFPVPDPRPVLAELGAGELAATLGDAILASRRPLSGGERQWIAIARALATGLPVLLLDEPTSALDGPAQARLLEAIARLRGKRTVLLVTHRPEPLAIADRVVRLDPSGAPSQGVTTSSDGPARTSTASARKSSPSRTNAP